MTEDSADHLLVTAEDYYERQCDTGEGGAILAVFPDDRMSDRDCEIVVSNCTAHDLIVLAAKMMALAMHELAACELNPDLAAQRMDDIEAARRCLLRPPVLTPRREPAEV